MVLIIEYTLHATNFNEKMIAMKNKDIREFGSVSMESVMDTVTRVFLGISLLGLTFSILSGTVANIRQIVDGLFMFIRGALSFIPGMGEQYFVE